MDTVHSKALLGSDEESSFLKPPLPVLTIAFITAGEGWTPENGTACTIYCLKIWQGFHKLFMSLADIIRSKITKFLPKSKQKCPQLVVLNSSVTSHKKTSNW